METTKPTLEETMSTLAKKINEAPEEKREEIETFLAGYLAGLERAFGKQAS